MQNPVVLTNFSTDLAKKQGQFKMERCGLSPLIKRGELTSEVTDGTFRSIPIYQIKSIDQ